METASCTLCRERRSLFVCQHCAMEMLQQRRTMLNALHADVAVLREKTEFAMKTKAPVFEVERKLEEAMRQMDALTHQLLQTRETLCTERIQFAERKNALDEADRLLEQTSQRIDELIHTQRHAIQIPVQQSLELDHRWMKERLILERKRKIQQLFLTFGVALPPSGGHDAHDASPPQKPPTSQHFRTICFLPMPMSGNFELLPVEVAAAALGKVIHLLNLLVKYMDDVTYPHPMLFNGSFSTIGSSNEGAECHTLYPDGSVGFDQGVEMLYQNVEFLCINQGIAAHELHPTDLLGNLIKLIRE